MQDVSKGEGRTVLFVSHNMASVKSLCSSGIVLNNGTKSFSGQIDDCIGYYLRENNPKGSNNLKYFQSKDFTQNIGYEITKFAVRADNKTYDEPIQRTDNIVFEIEVLSKSSMIFNSRISMRMKDDMGKIIFVTGADITINKTHSAKMFIPKEFFNEGLFFVDIQITTNERLLFRYEDAISFVIINKQRKIGSWMGKTPGSLRPKFKWELI